MSNSFRLQNPYNSEEMITLEYFKYYHDDFNTYITHWDGDYKKFSVYIVRDDDEELNSTRVPNLLFQLHECINTPGVY